MKAHSLNLILAMNASAAVLQRTSHSEADVLNTCRDEIARLGFRGGLALLVESDERLIIKTTVQPPWMKNVLAELEKRTGYKSLEYSFPVAQVTVYHQAIETRRGVFLPDSRETIIQLLPEPVQPLASIIIQALGTPPGIYAPLIIQDRIIGVMNIVGKQLTPDDIPAVEAFANHMAIALENARLFHALHDSQQHFRTLAEAAFEGIALTERGIYIDLNDQLATMLGYERDELIGKPVMQVVASESREHVAQANRAAQIEPHEHFALKKDGTIFPVEIRARISQIGDQSVRITAIRDITERKQAEKDREALIRNLESQNAELERFAYTVSHDLKSPLITIRGFLGLLEQDTLAGKTDLLKSDLLRIYQATDKMQQLLNELLELSRIGRLTNPPEEWPFESIAHEAVSLVEGQLAARNVKISIEFGMPRVYVDHARLVQVVQNLVDNAVKFMGDQPSPQIEIGMRGTDDNGKPIFFVRDNGIGIEPKYHKQIFGLFTKLDAQTKGTGVGLALVKRIVEVHGGRLWVESEAKGKGATFCFSLPIKPDPDLAPTSNAIA